MNAIKIIVKKPLAKSVLDFQGIIEAIDVIRTIADNGWRCFRVLMHLLILLLIKFCDCQSYFCIAYKSSFRSKWHICKEICKPKTFKTFIHRYIIISGFLGEQSTYKDVTWIRMSSQSLSSWMICTGKQARIRILFSFWTGEAFVLNTEKQTKIHISSAFGLSSRASTRR